MASVPGKFLNSANIAQKVFDATTDSIRITGSIGGATEVIIDAASGDNIAIKNSDGSNITSSNPLPVIVSGVGTSYINKTSYNELASIPSGVEVTIISYTASLTKRNTVLSVLCSGENIATYAMYVNGTPICKKRTYFGGYLNTDFIFNGDGVSLAFLDLVEIKVIHNRPSLSYFNATIIIKEEN